MNRRVWISWLTTIALAWIAAPVIASGDLVISFQVDASDYPTISVYVSVADSSGQPLTDLTVDNFEITEDNQPVAIEGFAGVGDPRPVDVVFVFDVTGSMQDEIEGVKQTCVRFADGLNRTGRDHRLGLVTFLDVIGGVYQTDGSLTGDVQEFKRWIGGLNARGGDDGPELALDALVQTRHMQFRDRAQRILILITDAPPHHRGDGSGFSDLTFDQTIEMLKEENITVFAVAPNIAELPEKDDGWRKLPGRYGLPAQNEYERMARELGGMFYDITRNSDFTGIIDEIGETISSQYLLTYRTPRPEPDGTLRDISVQVNRAGKSGSSTGGYLETHLLSVRSSPLVGLGCMLPVLLMLGAPVAWTRLRRPVSTSSLQQPILTPPSVTASHCWRCSALLRVEAKFCPECGAAQSAASTDQPVTRTCPTCNSTLRVAARFCNRCGTRLS